MVFQRLGVVQMNRPLESAAENALVQRGYKENCRGSIELSKTIEEPASSS